MTEREQRFRDLYGRTRDDVVRFAQRRAHPSHAEDIAADTFTVVWRRLDDAPAAPEEQRAWVFGIARHCLLTALRGEGRRGALAVRVREVGSDPPGRGGADDLDGALTRVDLASAWRRLSDDEQETLALTAFEELTSGEAARVLGISPAAYRVRLMRARRSLRRLLTEAEQASPQIASIARESAS